MFHIHQIYMRDVINKKPLKEIEWILGKTKIYISFNTF